MTSDLKTSLLKEMEGYFGKDARRIAHAHRVTEFAEQIMEAEEADPMVILAASVLHDIGIPVAKEKYGSAAGHYQEKEGPPIARRILEKLGWEEGAIDEACAIIGNHHSPGIIDSLNFRVVYDADWMVNLKDEYDIRDRQKLAQIIERVFLTKTGKALARRLYLEQKAPPGT